MTVIHARVQVVPVKKYTNKLNNIKKIQKHKYCFLILPLGAFLPNTKIFKHISVVKTVIT